MNDLQLPYQRWSDNDVKLDTWLAETTSSALVLVGPTGSGRRTLLLEALGRKQSPTRGVIVRLGESPNETESPPFVLSRLEAALLDPDCTADLKVGAASVSLIDAGAALAAPTALLSTALGLFGLAGASMKFVAELAASFSHRSTPGQWESLLAAVVGYRSKPDGQLLLVLDHWQRVIRVEDRRAIVGLVRHAQRGDEHHGRIGFVFMIDAEALGQMSMADRSALFRELTNVKAERLDVTFAPRDVHYRAIAARHGVTGVSEAVRDVVRAKATRRWGSVASTVALLEKIQLLRVDNHVLQLALDSTHGIRALDALLSDMIPPDGPMLRVLEAAAMEGVVFTTKVVAQITETDPRQVEAHLEEYARDYASRIDGPPVAPHDDVGVIGETDQATLTRWVFRVPAIRTFVLAQLDRAERIDLARRTRTALRVIYAYDAHLVARALARLSRDLREPTVALWYRACLSRPSFSSGSDDYVRELGGDSSNVADEQLLMALIAKGGRAAYSGDTFGAAGAFLAAHFLAQETGDEISVVAGLWRSAERFAATGENLRLAEVLLEAAERAAVTQLDKAHVTLTRLTVRHGHASGRGAANDPASARSVIDDLERVLAVFSAVGDGAGEFAAAHGLARHLWSIGGRRGEAREMLERIRENPPELSSYHLGCVLRDLAAMEQVDDRYTEALKYVDEAFFVSASIGPPHYALLGDLLALLDSGLSRTGSNEYARRLREILPSALVVQCCREFPRIRSAGVLLGRMIQDNNLAASRAVLSSIVRPLLECDGETWPLLGAATFVATRMPPMQDVVAELVRLLSRSTHPDAEALVAALAQVDGRGIVSCEIRFEPVDSHALIAPVVRMHCALKLSNGQVLVPGALVDPSNDLLARMMQLALARGPTPT